MSKNVDIYENFKGNDEKYDNEWKLFELINEILNKT